MNEQGLFQSGDPEKMKKNYITSEEFDRKFDDGEDVIEYFDLTTIQHPGLNQKRVSVDFPEWMVTQLDAVAKRLGVTRQSVIKVFISEKLKENSL